MNLAPQIQAAIANAQARRGQGGPQQVTQGSPNFNPNLVPPPAQQGGPGMQMPPGAAPPPPIQQGMGLPTQQGLTAQQPPPPPNPLADEASMIIKALMGRLQSNSKINESQNLPPAPPDLGIRA